MTRIDAAIARLSATACMVSGAKKQSGQPFKPDDFMVYIEREDEMSVDSVFKKLGGGGGK